MGLERGLIGTIEEDMSGEEGEVGPQGLGEETLRSIAKIQDDGFSGVG